MVLEIPRYAADVISVLEDAGHEAFAVGGCVRDALLLREPNDWDVTTSARPEEVRDLFSSLDGYTAIPTGMTHGTITVLSNRTPVEVTTYRIDGEYTDFRRPDTVEFCRELSADLARRDFTVNAMAYSDRCGLVDLYGGTSDLKNGVIRCVGDPVCRFTEDALRILRALRFAAVLGFCIEPLTAGAARSHKDLLSHVSRERIGNELGKLICAGGAASVIAEFRDIFREILPGLDLTDAAVSSVEKLCGSEIPLMLAALLGDTDPAKVRSMLRGCRFDNKTVSRAEIISANRHVRLADKTAVKRLCRSIGTDAAKDVIKLQISRGEADESLQKRLYEIIDGGECVSMAGLAIGGDELVSLGVPPRDIGRTLDALLDGVMEERLNNEREALISAVIRQNI